MKIVTNNQEIKEYGKLKQEREEYKAFTSNESKDYWTYTICAGCSALCGVKVRVVDGCPVAVEGIPESDLGSQGGMCAKGVSTIIDYHDPNRCNYPIKRTNPNKGLHEDPGWQRISWEEALDTIAQKINQARSKDPRSVIWAPTSGPGISLKNIGIVFGFFSVLSPGQRANNGAGFCTGFTPVHWIHATWQFIPDYRYCNYLLQCGGNDGVGAARPAGMSIRQAADARARGMKMIAMDPLGHIAGGKATEWIPILPATDSAVLLAMANLIVNEIGIYDKEYIRHKTNGPYLTSPSRLFLRDKDTNKPLLWDEKDSTAKTYDDPTLTHPALEGEFTIDGIKCQPAFQLLKEHLKQYEPEWASQLSTVPENTIHRLARELVEAARIGSVIEIGGVKLPYRPACVIGYKGASSHSNAWHQALSVILLNTLLGNQDVPGGILGAGAIRSFGHPESGRPHFEPFAGYDGMLTGDVWSWSFVWPPKSVTGPGLVNFMDILAYSHATGYPYCDDWEELWTNAGRPYEPEVLGIYGANIAINGLNPEQVEGFLKKLPFIFSINTIHNETTEGFADIVLPDCHPFETLEPFTSVGYYFNYPTGLDKWSFHLRMPVVEPKYERRDTLDIFWDLAERIGIKQDFNFRLENYLLGAGLRVLRKRDEVKEFEIIRPEENISVGELTNRVLKHNFGEEHGLDWFKEHGFITWEKKPEEAYWRNFVNARIPIYFESLQQDKAKISEAAESIGMHLNWDYYTPLPSYFPSVIYIEPPPESEFDLIAISHRDILHTHRFTAENPWLDEMSETNPYVYTIVMNLETAKKKGIKDGDFVCIENHWGDKTTGRVKLALAIHPQVIGTVSAGGGWAKGRPIARGKGVNHNQLLRSNQKYMCPVLGMPEQAVRVKLYRVEAAK